MSYPKTTKGWKSFLNRMGYDADIKDDKLVNTSAFVDAPRKTSSKDNIIGGNLAKALLYFISR